jgi:hypothetical protein
MSFERSAAPLQELTSINEMSQAAQLTLLLSRAYLVLHGRGLPPELSQAGVAARAQLYKEAKAEREKAVAEVNKIPTREKFLYTVNQFYDLGLMTDKEREGAFPERGHAAAS